MVQEGDLVEEGQVLATLETANIQQALLQAEATLRSAQAQLVKAKAGARPEEIAGAEARGQECPGRCQSRRNGGQDRPRQRGRGASVAEQRAGQPQQAGGRARRRSIYRSPRSKSKRPRMACGACRASAMHWEGPAAVSPSARRPRRQVASQESQIVIAQLQLEQLRAGSRPEDIAVAKAQVEQARASLQVAQAQLGQAETQVESAQAQAEQAQAQLDLLRVGPPPRRYRRLRGPGCPGRGGAEAGTDRHPGRHPHGPGARRRGPDQQPGQRIGSRSGSPFWCWWTTANITSR